MAARWASPTGRAEALAERLSQRSSSSRSFSSAGSLRSSATSESLMAHSLPPSRAPRIGGFSTIYSRVRSQRVSAGFQSIELRFPRELAATHIGGVTFCCLRHDIAQIPVATDEFGRPVEQPDHVVGDEDLAVAFRRRADSDGRHGDLLCDLVREVGCHALDDNSEGPGLIGFARLGEHPCALRGVAPLGLEAALDIDRLRSQPDVTYNRDAAPGQECNRVGNTI